MFHKAHACCGGRELPARKQQRLLLPSEHHHNQNDAENENENENGGEHFWIAQEGEDVNQTAVHSDRASMVESAQPQQQNSVQSRYQSLPLAILPPFPSWNMPTAVASSNTITLPLGLWEMRTPPLSPLTLSPYSSSGTLFYPPYYIPDSASSRDGGDVTLAAAATSSSSSPTPITPCRWTSENTTMNLRTDYVVTPHRAVAVAAPTLGTSTTAAAPTAATTTTTTTTVDDTKEWICPHCTLHNPIHQVFCGVCWEGRPQQYGPATAHPERREHSTHDLFVEDASWSWTAAVAPSFYYPSYSYYSPSYYGPATAHPVRHEFFTHDLLLNDASLSSTAAVAPPPPLHQYSWQQQTRIPELWGAINGRPYQQLLQMFGNGNANHGANETIIQALPMSRVMAAVPATASSALSSGGDGDSDSNEQQGHPCMVCLEDFCVGDECKTLPCLHRFHVNCIDRWLCQNASCPLCKRSIVKCNTIINE